MAFTYFFRDRQTLDMIRDHVLPVLNGRRHLDIWDAGCAMGPEPYTLAILIRETMGRFMFRNVRIHATDIDGSNLFGKTIADGIYPHEMVQRIPRDLFRKYFEPVPRSSGQFIIREDLRRSVHFTRHDLLSLAPIRRNLSLIVCKNVLLHFSERERVEVLKMFYGALDDEGFLAMEQTQKIPGQVERLFTPLVTNARIFRKAARCAPVGSPRP